jgi:hypothetical protein
LSVDGDGSDESVASLRAPVGARWRRVQLRLGADARAAEELVAALEQDERHVVGSQLCGGLLSPPRVVPAVCALTQHGGGASDAVFGAVVGGAEEQHADEYRDDHQDERGHGCEPEPAADRHRSSSDRAGRHVRSPSKR